MSSIALLSSLAVPLPELPALHTQIAKYSIQLVGTETSAMLQMDRECALATLAGYNVAIDPVVWSKLPEESFSLPTL